MSMVPHGGDLAAAEARWGRPAEGWLDLSTGINPVPYPVPPIGPAAWHRLPQHDRLQALLKTARACYGTPADAPVVAAPGTQILIQLLPRLRPGARVAILGPTYGEHAACWAAEGATVATVGLLEQAAEADVVVLVNPNNPDGCVVGAGRLPALADRLAARGGLLVVDEAFAEVKPWASVASEAGRPGLLILRSFGKFFGLAGIRLGFAIGAATEIERLARWLGPWAVPGPAIETGIAALSDQDWQDQARTRLSDDAARLTALLLAHGFTDRGGTDLFRLVEHPEAARIWDRLGRAGILVRPFPDRPRLLRFGLPGDDAGFARLAAALG
ncbi:threonine-phosphate decarboxylase CobD [Inquilinus limosus]|uniref:threonine-phosphate decarboxylase n=1 Tax=Inquilinus limosus TaxID=171674 RepID=A0A211ZIB0_9PROT|nr:threonine-phosphate decarboxylase CobD [Inquilinus limosus]OWJ64926.1 threonine-phosphate decarboxylase [Inquilinus limosus]